MMKWAFAIQRKIRLAIALAIMMLVIILLSLLESYNVNKISKSFHSIYEDRLIPAVDLYLISGHIQAKRNKLVLFLFTDKMNAEDIEEVLSSENKQLEKLINKYEKTYLVKAETNHLQNLKKNLEAFEREELLLINASVENKVFARNLYLKNTNKFYDLIDQELIMLTQVQKQIGKELLAESNKSQSSSSLISQLQIVVAIILGLIIMILVITDKQVILKQEKYNLN